MEEINFIKKFNKKKKLQLLLILSFFIIDVSFFWQLINNETEQIFYIPTQVAESVFFLFVLGGIIFIMNNWRCPSCNRHLGFSINPKECNKCKVKLK